MRREARQIEKAHDRRHVKQSQMSEIRSDRDETRSRRYGPVPTTDPGPPAYKLAGPECRWQLSRTISTRWGTSSTCYHYFSSRLVSRGKPGLLLERYQAALQVEAHCQESECPVFTWREVMFLLSWEWFPWHKLSFTTQGAYGGRPPK